MAEELNNDNTQKVENDSAKDSTLNKVDQSPAIKNNLQEDMQELPHGEALTIEETYRITSSREAKFILLAGPSASGKTTLVTTIYCLFQKGPLAKYLFAGSETLLGFEQRVYNLTTSSNNTSPAMTKTRRGVDDILHLRLYNSKNMELKDLLITDLSGEDYDRIIGNVDLAISDFKIIKRADYIVIFVDGDLISQDKSRNRAEQSSFQLLKTIRDAGLINKNACVDVLISKYDEVLQRAKVDPSVDIFIKRLKEKFKKEFSNLSNLRILDVAAMPKSTEELEVGYGLKDLIPFWVECNSSILVQTDAIHSANSEFNLFYDRCKVPIES